MATELDELREENARLRAVLDAMRALLGTVAPLPQPLQVPLFPPAYQPPPVYGPPHFGQPEITCATP